MGIKMENGNLERLEYECVSHAAFTSYTDDDTGADMPGLASVRYYRFERPSELHCLRIYPTTIRWAPPVYSQPKTVAVSVYEDGGWKEVLTVDLPCMPHSEGEEEKFYTIELPSIRASAIRLTCDEEHPVEPSHGEQWANPKVVPFRILEKVEWLGVYTGEASEPVYNSPLIHKSIRPEAPDGMKVEDTGIDIRFTSDFFSVSFNKRRPLITELGWDAFGNRWNEKSLVPRIANDNLWCGPIYRGLDTEVLPKHWGGEFEVDGNRVVYHNLSPFAGLKLDVVFTVHHDGMDMDIRQEADSDIPAAEYCCWLFPWDGAKALVGTLGLPDRTKGRTGVVPLPAYWNAPGGGSMLVSRAEGDDTWLQVDSWRAIGTTFSGLMTGVNFDEHGFLTIKKGVHKSKVSIRKQPILPKLKAGVKLEDVPEGILRHWATVFTFRPELAGFGNSTLSCNCHISQSGPSDMAAVTEKTPGAPDMMDLARYTIEFALRGGPGYGDIRDMYMDSDPVLVYSAARLHSADPGHAWSRENWPFIMKAARRSMSFIDESGLLCCPTLTGNSGSHQWSSNTWDVVSFGHYDAYVNALSYRAFCWLQRVALNLGHTAEAEEARLFADKIKAAYSACFLNPETGWIGGWRSRDGELHDYCFVFINCLAIVHGLIDKEEACEIMRKIEQKREEMGLESFRYGMPTCLIPVAAKDLALVFGKKGRIRSDGWDDYGNYVNGSLTTVFVEYYVSALSMCGFEETADKFLRDLNCNLVSNEITKSEFFTWEGYVCGYEGVLVGCYRVLLSMLEHLRAV
jgi:hypothetical protein